MKIEGFSSSALSDLQLALQRSQPDVNITVQPPQVNVDMAEVAGAIYHLQSTLSTRLDLLVRTMSNPTATAGEEMLRRGALAWHHAWWDDARRDLTASIETYPYRGAPHFFLGLTELALGHSSEALDAFRSSVKYGAAGDAECAVAAALIAERMLRAVGASDLALAILTQAACELPSCIPVLSRLAALSDEPANSQRLLATLISTGRADSVASRLAHSEAEQLRSELAIDVVRLCETLIQIGDLLDSLAESELTRGLLDGVRGPLSASADTGLEWLELHDQRGLPTDALAWCQDVARRFSNTDWTVVLPRLRTLRISFKTLKRENKQWLERNTGMARDPAYRGGGSAKKRLRTDQYNHELARLLFQDTEAEVAAMPVEDLATLVTRLYRQLPAPGSIEVIEPAAEMPTHEDASQ